MRPPSRARNPELGLPEVLGGENGGVSWDLGGEMRRGEWAGGELRAAEASRLYCSFILYSWFRRATALEKRFLPVWLGLSLLMSISTMASNEVVIIGLNSNQVLSGVVEIPVELHATNVDAQGVFFQLDGEPSSSIINPSWLPPKLPISGIWRTTELSNGWHTLQAFADYPDPAMNNQGGYNEYRSPPVRVQVFNPLIVDIPPLYGDMDTGVPFAFPIKAFVAATNATWKVTISTVSNQVLRVLTGVTTNGIIETTWDGKDLKGTRIRPEWVDFEIEASPTNRSPRAVEHRRATLQGRPRLRNGQGTETFPDGSKYVGEFKNGLFNGQGTWTSQNGSEQRGEWKDDEPYRVSGIDISRDGTKEVGTWNYDGTKSGGTITWKDGREYNGDWKVMDGATDLPEGTGFMKYPDGRKYVGQFHDGKMDGTGKMTYPDGKVEDGLWKDDKFVGASTSP